MATLKLAKLKRDGQLLSIESTAIYDTATKTTLAQYISDTNTEIGNLKSSIAGKAPVRIVETIAARDALTTTADGVITGSICYVTDASADTTVTSGAASYLANVTGTTITWTKLTEYESMDLVLDWAHLADKPTSTVSAIDSAVNDSHTHSNAAVLDAISKNATSGNLVFNNVELDGSTGIAFMTSDSDTPSYFGKLQIFVEDFDTEA